jgi:hypothetical protein
MNKSSYNQTNGYPLNTERLQELQTSFEIFNSCGSLAGNYTIISGCNLTGSTVQNGFIFINGELLEFRESAVTPTSAVIIVETTVVRPFETGPDKVVYIKRHATFGTADISYPWSQFKRPIETKEIQAALDGKQDKTSAGNLLARIEMLEKKNAVFLMGGGMVVWCRPVSEIPPGWRVAANWQGRVPVGFNPNDVDFNYVGKVGGFKNKSLSKEEMPAHRHSIGGDFDENDDNGGFVINGGEYNVRTSYTSIAGGPPGSTVEGPGVPFSLMNPHRVVCFIEWIGF